ncbi:hypothetical protein [Massilia sp. ZL223]|nr:hypothetical protein [Massilia sp. ZL223]
MKLQLRERGMSYLTPLKDKGWDDDSLVVYEFQHEKEGATP